MAIYINSGYDASDTPAKHLDQRCPVLNERAEQGFPIKRTRNPDHKKPLDQHVYVRCPVCFEDSGPLTITSIPRWVERAKAPEYKPTPGTSWVYDIKWEPGRICQVGKADDLAKRFRTRWRATRKGRFTASDSIWWYYDLLCDDPATDLTFEAWSYPSAEAAVQAEQELRERRRAEGWQVSSDV